MRTYIEVIPELLAKIIQRREVDCEFSKNFVEGLEESSPAGRLTASQEELNSPAAPMMCLAVGEAVRLAEALGGRIPTLAEWFYAFADRGEHILEKDLLYRIRLERTQYFYHIMTKFETTKELPFAPSPGGLSNVVPGVAELVRVDGCTSEFGIIVVREIDGNWLIKYAETSEPNDMDKLVALRLAR